MGMSLFIPCKRPSLPLSVCAACVCTCRLYVSSSLFISAIAVCSSLCGRCSAPPRVGGGDSAFRLAREECGRWAHGAVGLPSLLFSFCLISFLITYWTFLSLLSQTICNLIFFCMLLICILKEFCFYLWNWSIFLVYISRSQLSSQCNFFFCTFYIVKHTYRRVYKNKNKQFSELSQILLEESL